MNYHRIIQGDMLNGPGYGLALFISGCSLHCKKCHNPETWDYYSGKLFDKNAEEEIINSLWKDYNSRLTITGGHPLDPNNYKTVLDLCKKIRKIYGDSKTIWVYTGYEWEQVKDLEIMKYIDVLVDGSFIEELKDEKLHWRGSSNQNVIDVKDSLKTGFTILYCE